MTVLNTAIALERLFPRTAISTDPKDFAKAFTCLAGKITELNVVPELAFSVIAEFSHDALKAGLITLPELNAHYDHFKITHPWSTEGVSAYATQLAEWFDEKATAAPAERQLC